MAQTTKWFRKGLANFLGGETAGEARVSDYLSNTMKCMLTTDVYVPDLSAHEVKADVTNEVAGGSGYTTGGVTLASKTLVGTVANSYARQWQSATVYAAGDVVRPTSGNTNLYMVVVAGTSHTVEPTWGIVFGRETPEGAGTVVWCLMGKSIVVLDAADPQWTASTFTARYGVVYDDTATDKPLYCLIDFDGNLSPSAGTLTITLRANEGLVYALMP
jgi:hypothetical protein